MAIAQLTVGDHGIGHLQRSFDRLMRDVARLAAQLGEEPEGCMRESEAQLTEPIYEDYTTPTMAMLRYCRRWMRCWTKGTRCLTLSTSAKTTWTST